MTTTKHVTHIHTHGGKISGWFTTALAIPAIIMVLHHAGVFTMPDLMVRITGILILCSLFGVGYLAVKMRNEK